MSPEDTVLCLCTRQNFDESHRQELINICQCHQIQWKTVYATAEQHSVSPLVYANLANNQTPELALPQDILNRFKKSYMRNVFVKNSTSAILEKLLALFAKKGIDVMLVKGAALDRLVYEQPWYMVSYDVDLVIKARPDEMSETDHREIVDTIEGVNHQRHPFREHIEYDFFEHHDVTMNNVLAVDFRQLWQQARQIQVGKYDVFVLTPEDMLLATAINSCRKRFFRLKALCDIAETIKKSPELDWELVVDKAYTYECNTILYTALQVTQMTLGCELPAEIWPELRVNPVRATLINRLIRYLSHNFSLMDLFTRSDDTLLGRQFSWPLVLTYSTYRVDHLIPKMDEIYRAWRNPLPSVP